MIYTSLSYRVGQTRKPKAMSSEVDVSQGSLHLGRRVWPTVSRDAEVHGGGSEDAHGAFRQDTLSSTVRW